MQKSEIVKRFKAVREELASAKEIEIPKVKNEVLELDYEAAFDTIIELVKEGNTVATPVGTFDKVHREARKGRNPKENIEIDIPAKDVFHYKKNAAVKKIFATEE